MLFENEFLFSKRKKKEFFMMKKRKKRGKMFENEIMKAHLIKNS